MAVHEFVTISGTRHDITGVDITREHACDRCGRYMTTWTSIDVACGLVIGAEFDVPVDLCEACVRDHFPGLADIAVKVLGHA